MSTLGMMGFTPEQARLALKETGNNLERAADWIFSHQPQLDALLAAEKSSDAAVASGGYCASVRKNFTDGRPK